MYYRKALELQAFLDMANDEGTWPKLDCKCQIMSSLLHWSKSYLMLLVSELMKGYKAAELNSEGSSKSDNSTWQQCQAIVDLKFTYVVSCQQYGKHKRAGHPLAKDILRLMTT